MGEDIDKRDPAVRETIAGRFNRMIPHNQAIGLQVADVAGERIRTTLANRADFLGDPEAGLWHTAIGTTVAISTTESAGASAAVVCVAVGDGSSSAEEEGTRGGVPSPSSRARVGEMKKRKGTSRG